MSQIIIEGNNGQLRMNAASLNLLIEEEIESLKNQRVGFLLAGTGL